MSHSNTDDFCKNEVNRYPFYSPRFWAGMRIGDYVGMLAKNGFRLHPSRIPMLFLVGGCAVTSSGLSLMQSLFLSRKIRQTELVKPPVFVVGHWRSGTTLLHELLGLDDQFAWPSTFECFMPTHYLLSGRALQPLVRLLMPSQRPMDSMPAGPQYPQEDEFALIGLGAPTPYYNIAFCNEDPRYLELLNLNRADAGDVEDLRDSLTWFYQSLTYRKQKQLILKSPTHTGRIGHLARWFPDAKFVHITRHPYKIFPSTMHLWKTLAHVQGYQLPRNNDAKLIDYVNRCYAEMYEGYFDQVGDIPEENIVQIRFEELIEDPVSQIESIYSRFDLRGFDTAKARLEDFWAQRKSHRFNKTRLNEETRVMIDEIWADYIDRFGYSLCEV